MEQNQKLFAEALADAKTLQKVALVNAKKSLEEAFGPKIESMFKSKLAEMEKDEMSENDELDENQNNGEINEMEQELESILQELGMDEQESVEESEEMFEADDEESKPAKKDKPAAPKSEKPAAAPGADEFGEEESEEVGELTVDEFTSIVRSAVQDAMGGGAGDEMGMDGDMEPEMDDMGGDPSLDGMDADMGGDELGGAPGEEEELDLDELIAELNSDVNEGEELEEGEETNESEEVNEGEELEESEDLEEGEEIDEAAKKAFFEKGRAKGGKVGKPFAQGKPGFQKAPTGKTKKMSEVTSQELQEAVKKAFFEKGRAKGGKVGKPFSQGKPGFQKAPTGKTKKMSEATEQQLQEAVSTIKSLKSTLKETNLLNAKLLFVNNKFRECWLYKIDINIALNQQVPFVCGIVITSLQMFCLDVILKITMNSIIMNYNFLLFGFGDKFSNFKFSISFFILSINFSIFALNSSFEADGNSNGLNDLDVFLYTFKEGFNLFSFT